MAGKITFIVVGILAAIIIIGSGIGIWFWLGSTQTSSFSYEEYPTSLPNSTVLDINLGGGAVQISFQANPSLLYAMLIDVAHFTLQQYGIPEPTYSNGEVDLTYPGASVEIVLGSGTNYSINVETAAGFIGLNIGSGAHIDGDILLQTTAASIDFDLTTSAVINSNISVQLQTTTGNVNADVSLPAEIGGRFIATETLTNYVNIETSSWDQISANEYETPDFSAASRTVSIAAINTVGNIEARLN